MPPPLVNGYGVVVLAPVNGSRDRDRTPALIVRPTSVLGQPLDVQVEWAAQRTMTPVEQATTLSQVSSGDQHSVSPAVDLPYRTTWYRARAGQAATGVWSSWTEVRFLEVTPVLGSLAEYTDANMGVRTVETVNAVEYIAMNVGVGVVIPDAVQVLHINVGVTPVLLVVYRYIEVNFGPLFGPASRSGVRVVDMNVNTERPVPHIWWIRPEQGREGYVFNIYGHGFGAFQGEYDGAVMLGELVCPISFWEEFPEDPMPPGGHVIVRADRPEDDVLTPEHCWVVAVVPYAALSGNVRIMLGGV